MAEEIEVPTEHLHDALKEAAEKGSGGGHESGEGGGPQWIPQAALSAAIVAVIAAIAALLAGKHANEAMMDQMRATDEWSHYQAKGVKSQILQTRIDLLAALGKPAPAADQEKIKEYPRDQKEIEEKATEYEHGANEHMVRHESFAKSVTLSQVAIALTAVAVLARRKAFWFASLAFGIVGAALLIHAVL